MSLEAYAFCALHLWPFNLKPSQEQQRASALDKGRFYLKLLAKKKQKNPACAGAVLMRGRSKSGRFTSQRPHRPSRHPGACRLWRVEQLHLHSNPSANTHSDLARNCSPQTSHPTPTSRALSNAQQSSTNPTMHAKIMPAGRSFQNPGRNPSRAPARSQHNPFPNEVWERPSYKPKLRR